MTGARSRGLLQTWGIGLGLSAFSVLSLLWHRVPAPGTASGSTPLLKPDEVWLVVAVPVLLLLPLIAGIALSFAFQGKRRSTAMLGDRGAVVASLFFLVPSLLLLLAPHLLGETQDIGLPLAGWWVVGGGVAMLAVAKSLAEDLDPSAHDIIASPSYGDDMTPELSQSDIAKLHLALRPKYSTQTRTVWMGGINPSFVTGIATAADPASQLLNDLNSMNSARLTDGSTPLITFLANAVLILDTDASVEVVREQLQQLRSRVARLDLADPSHLGGAISAAQLSAIGDLPASTLAELGLVTASSPLAAEQLEALMGRDDRLGPAFFEGALAARALVARLWVPKVTATAPHHEGGPYTFGTAWMITPTLALTCHHVISLADPDASIEDLQARAAAARLHFGDRPPTAGDEAPDVSGTTLRAAVWGEDQLDFAVLELPEPRQGHLAVCPHLLAIDNDQAYVAANIIQYPRGGDLSFGFRNNLIDCADDHHVLYRTDTEVGASGAPVFDDRWQVRAQHQKARGTRNQGTQIAAILRWLRKNDEDLYDEIEAEGSLLSD